MKNLSVLKWLLKNTKGNILKILSLSVISAVSSARFVAFALISKEIIDIATKQKSVDILSKSMIIFLLIGAQAILNIIYANISIRATGKMTLLIRKNIFADLIKKKYLKLGVFHTGELMNRLTSDVEIIVNGVSNIIPNAISLLTKLVSCFIVLFAISPPFSLGIIFVSLIMLGFSSIFSKKMKQLHKAVQQTDGKTRSFMQENLENIIVIKTYKGKSVLLKKLSELQSNNFLQKLKRNFFSNLANTSIFVVFSSSYYVALTFGAIELSKSAITFGTLTAFLQIINQIQTPFVSFSSMIPQYYSVIASAERLIELEQIEEEQEIESFDKSIYDTIDKIVFENVSFKYDNEPVLTNFNLSINKGNFIGIAGQSGIGKSTIFKLILGLITPDSGNVFIVNKGGDKIPLDASGRSLFAYVPQGNMLLSGTIKENIAFFNEYVTDSDINNASKTADIYDFIQTLPQKYDTIIGERGLGLSEGQIQRLAIARGIISGAPILLLDEVTSALDETTQTTILNNLKKLNNKTVLLISHKQSSLSFCDEIVEI